MCIHEGCQTRANFNFKGKKAKYCSKHKSPGMVNVNAKHCDHPGCKKQPIFNFEGEKTGLFCSKHKSPGMVNVNDKKCIHEGCQKIPLFNTEGEKTGLFCSEHKSPGMVNVKDKKCIHEGCQKIPIFNFEGEKTGLFCSKHKSPGMVNVKDKKCIHEGCQKIPLFNTEGEKTGLFCLEHKSPGMENVKDKKCKTHMCDTQVGHKYEGYCFRCYIYTFPNRPVARNYKTKELSVVEYVKSHWPDLDWIADKPVSNGCSRRRPDLLLDLGYQIIIVEIDEHMHTSYDCICENERTTELSRDLGHRPIVFIRFNPDKYTNKGLTISSCWGYTAKSGICAVKKGKINEWSARLDFLGEQIRFWTNPENITDKTIETIQLFYDN